MTTATRRPDTAMDPLPHHDVAVIGAGFSGLGAAITLLRDGRDDLVVLERAEALGGTWHANHYPGCACDVPTPYYSYSFAPKPDWSRLYASHDEIRGYLEDCADRFGVRPHLRLGTTVTGLAWDHAARRWTVAVDGAPALTARVVVAAPGGLSRPAYPDLEGLGDFAGPWFHSAEWDHDVDLTGARVAVIGTGASAIQFVPRIARTAAHVDVFQRTPNWVLPKLDRPIPAWERRLYRRVPAAQRLLRFLLWATQEWMGLGNTVDRRLTRPLEWVATAHMRRVIRDPDLRRRLTPRYAIGCKRVLLANDWFPTLARDHVDLVTDGVARITERGVLTATGEERPADVLVFGTGFDLADPFGPIDVRGRDGVRLRDRYAQRGAAHRGTTVAGFPNLFVLPGPNTGTGHTSQVFMIEAQLAHVMAALRRLDARGAAALEPRAEAEAAWTAEIDRRSARSVWLRGGCSSWYLDREGRNTTLWPGTSLAFRRALRDVRDDEFVFHGPPGAPDAPEAPAAPAHPLTTTSEATP